MRMERCKTVVLHSVYIVFRVNFKGFGFRKEFSYITDISKLIFSVGASLIITFLRVCRQIEVQVVIIIYPIQAGWIRLYNSDIITFTVI